MGSHVKETSHKVYSPEILSFRGPLGPWESVLKRYGLHHKGTSSHFARGRHAPSGAREDRVFRQFKAR